MHKGFRSCKFGLMERAKRAFPAAACLLVVATGLILAKKFWEKPYTEWKRKEVLKILNDSPWAGQITSTRQYGGRNTRGVTGEREIYDTTTIRFFSALPVREAYVRMMQLMNRYDELGEQEKQALDRRFSAPLRLDVSNQIIIAVEFSSNDRQLGMQIDRTLRTATAKLLQQKAYLISERLERVQLKAYFPPSPDGTGAKFIFPRQVEGEPVVSKEDKEVTFELYLPDIPKIYMRKKVKNLFYKGKLEI